MVRRHSAAPNVSANSAKIFAWLAMWLLVRSLSAQESELEPDFEVTQILVPATDQQKVGELLRGEDHMVMPLQRLEALLPEVETANSDSGIGKARLERAIYVARFANGIISSDASSWQFSGAGPVGIGGLGLAIGRGRGVPLDALQVVDEELVVPGGLVGLNVGTRDKTFWFGFSLSANAELESNSAGSNESTQEQAFSFEIPIATSATMLVATSSSVRLSSEDVVIEAVEEVDSLLANWPSFPTTVAPNQKWWKVHLSGRSSFDLRCVEEKTTNSDWYQHVLSRTVLDYSIAENHLDLVANYGFSDYQPGRPIKLRLDESVRIREVKVGGQILRWNTLPSASGVSSVAEIDVGPVLAMRDAPIELTVRASCEINPERASDSLNLPSVSVAGAYALKGECNLKPTTGVSISDVTSSSGNVSLEAASETSADESTNLEKSIETTQPTAFGWSVTWQGEQPSISMTSAQSGTNWEAESLTSFQVNSEWLSGSCRIRLVNPSITSNEIRLLIGEGWFLDSVELSDGSPDDYLVEYRQAGEDGRVELVINWTQKRQAVSLELEVKAHQTLSRQQRVRRIVRLPGANQVDNYVLGDIGKYRVDLGLNLLFYQKFLADLPPWQQDLVSDDQHWIFQGSRSFVPPIQLVLGSQELSASLVTKVENGNSLSIDYYIEITSQDDASKELLLGFPTESRPAEIRWDLLTDLGSFQVSAVPQAIDADTNIRISLPRSPTSTWLLHGSRRLDLSEEQVGKSQDIWLPRVSNAESFQSTILLDRELLLRSDLVNDSAQNADFVPLEDCCSRQVENELGSDFLEQAHLVAVRLQGQVDGSIAFTTLKDRESITASWISTERVEHWVDGQNRLCHKVAWNVDCARAQKLEIEIPRGWRLDSLKLDGQQASAPASGEQDFLSNIEIPIKAGSSKVDLEFTSDAPEILSWLWKLTVVKPSSNFEVQQTECWAFVSPDRTLVSFEPKLQHNRGLLDRLRPAYWWDWLSLEYASNESNSSQLTQWTSVDIGALGNQRADVWMIKRSAIASLSFVAALVVFVATLWVAKVRPLIGWGSLAVLCVLLMLVPVGLVGLVQIVAIAVALASVLCSFLFGKGIVRAPQRTHDHSSRIRKDSVIRRTSAGVLAVLILSAFGLTANAQSENDPKEQFKVLVPVQDGKPVGVAYVPKRLTEKLESMPKKEPVSVSGILSADYTVRLADREGIDGEDILTGLLTSSLPGDALDNVLTNLNDDIVLDEEATDQLVLEFSAQFRVVVGRVGDSLRIPLLSGQLTLQRAEVDGKTEVESVVRQTAGDLRAVVFTPDMPGEFVLKLYFRPEVVASGDGVARIQANVPAISSAKMRILHSSTTSIAVRSIGEQQLNGTQTIVSLGPAREIDVSWGFRRKDIQRIPAIQRETGTWLYADGDQLTALSAIAIQSANVEEELNVFIDDSWEAIGNDWGDFRLIESQRSPLSTRRVYQVRLREEVVMGAGDVASLRVLLTPRVSGSSTQVRRRPLPFVQLGVAAVDAERRLRWTAEANAAWSLDSTQFVLPGISVDDDLFGSRPLSGTYETFSVPLGASVNALIYEQQKDSPEVVEQTTIRFGISEARVTHAVTFVTPETLPDRFQIALPLGARIKSVLLDGTTCQFQMTRLGEKVLLQVVAPSGSSSAEVLLVEYTKPVRLRREFQLERPILSDVNARTSSVDVYCASGLECSLDLQDQSIDSDEARTGAELSELEEFSGQFELRDLYRDQTSLPITFVLSRDSSEAPIETQAVLYVENASDEWMRKLRVRVESEVSPHQFMLSVPSTSIDSIRTDLPAKFIETGDPEQQIMAIQLPRESGTPLDFEIDFPSIDLGSGEVSLPNVRLLTGNTEYPTLALAKEVDAQPIHWMGRLMPILGEWEDPFSPVGLFDYFETSGPTEKVSWQEISAAGRRPSASLRRLKIRSVEDKHIFGVLEYWLQPNGQLSFGLTVPDGVKVVGAELGERTAGIVQEKKQRVRMLLDTSATLVRAKLFLRWERSSAGVEGPRYRLVLPIADDEPTGLDLLVGMSTSTENLKPIDAVIYTSREYAREWAGFTRIGAQNLASDSLATKQDWIEMWNPSSCSVLDSETLIDLEADDPGGSTTVAEYWSEKCTQLGIAYESKEEYEDPAVYQFVVSGNAVELEVGEQGYSDLPTRSLAALALVVLFSSLWFAGKHFQTHLKAVLAEHPWLLWMQLAVLLFVFLPAAWPSLVVGVAAIFLAVTRFLDRRKSIPFH